jgi:hypothetical protein
MEKKLNKHVSKPLKHGKNFIRNMSHELQKIIILETWEKKIVKTSYT